MNMPNGGVTTPKEIEECSFAIISRELDDMGIVLDAETAPIVKRVIHTTADFDYAHNLRFSPDAVTAGREALREGIPLITDTQMARAGINRKALQPFGVQIHCHIADDEVAATAAALGCTRSRAAVDKAAALWGDAVFVVGNAPTALFRICELVTEGRLRPRLIIGTPVGFVNVTESKEALAASGVPHIVAAGRKGGSNVAAAICNALAYSLQA